MALKIDSVEKVSVTTTAKDVAVNYRAFIIENCTAEKTVYFKEKDGVAVTVDNGFELIGQKIFDKVLRAKTLSIKGSEACDVRILYVTEEE